MSLVSMLNRGCASMGSTSSEIAPDPSPIMEKGHRKPHNVLEDGLSQDLMDAGRFCFNCEHIFSNRGGLEEHVCTDTSYICSCGTEFTLYNDMLEHSTTHEPGHQVLYHETIKKRRIEKRLEEEAQLKRLQTGEVVWRAPQSEFTIPMSSAQGTQVPEFNPSMSSETSASTNPATSASDMQIVAAGLRAPAVDMWTVYQPVVLLQTRCQVNKKKTYSCGACGQCFKTISSLICHHSCHVTDKVSGCVRCGLLLSSKKLLPRFHFCNSPNASAKFKLITAKPPNFKKASTDGIVQRPQATPSLQMKRRNPRVASQAIRTPCGTSSLQIKNLNIGANNKSNRAHHVPPPLLLKSVNSSASKPNNASTKTKQLKTPKISASGKVTPSPPNGFPCRICHLAFETDKLLQRHKCAKAREFLKQNAQGGRQHPKLTGLTPMENPVTFQMNCERKPMAQFAGNMKKNKLVAVGLDRGQDVVNRNAGVGLEGDCYVVDSVPDKPAEMIYQVTSSVPIKT